MGRRLYQLSFSCIVVGAVLVLWTSFNKEDPTELTALPLKPTFQLHQRLPPASSHGAVVNEAFVNVSSGKDVLVFIHIQKTGGSSFLARLTTAEALDGRPLCAPPNSLLKKGLNKKKDFAVCPLKRSGFESSELPEMWLASERTYGWVCGVHPFLFEMKSCLGPHLIQRYGLRKRNFHYITMIRHPVLRYLSEFLHVTRGATWLNKHMCDGHTMEGSMPPCYPGYYTGQTWRNVTLDKFLRCSTNWANNRQTIMLANLSSVACLASNEDISRSDRDYLLLESAKASLREMAFFGLSEYFEESCILFQKQFNLKFQTPCRQKNMNRLHSSSMASDVWLNRTLHSSIVLSNHLDMQLYDFALSLFTTRLSKYNIIIDRYKVDKEVQNFHRQRVHRTRY